MSRGGGRALAERFWAKVDKSAGDNGCWLWTASLNIGGYGTFALTHRRAVRAHRWAYEALVGPIPDGLQIDHLCRTRACVNPAHMEPVTGKENCLRAPSGPIIENARKTHCIHGHPLSGDNLRIKAGTREGRRVCIACAREASQRCRDRKLEALHDN